MRDELRKFLANARQIENVLWGAKDGSRPRKQCVVNAGYIENSLWLVKDEI